MLAFEKMQKILHRKCPQISSDFHNLRQTLSASLVKATRRMDFENPGQAERGGEREEGEGFSLYLYGFSPRTSSSLLLRSHSFLVNDKAAAKIYCPAVQLCNFLLGSCACLLSHIYLCKKKIKVGLDHSSSGYNTACLFGHTFLILTLACSLQHLVHKKLQFILRNIYFRFFNLYTHKWTIFLSWLV